MVSIPGWAYAVVGLAVAIYSKFIQSRAAEPKGALTLFFWIGIGLLVIGVFKLVAGFISGKKSNEKSMSEQSRSERERPGWARDYIICPRCNAKLNPQSKFCNWCGTRQ